MDYEDLSKGFPRHLRGDVKDVADFLVREGVISRKVTCYGKEVWLNRERALEMYPDALG